MTLGQSLAAALMSLLLAACGGSSAGTSAGTTTSKASSQAAGTATSAPGSATDTAAPDTAATTTTTNAGRPPEVPARKAKQGGGVKSTASSDVSIPAAFVIAPGGKLSPPSVSVPPGIAVALGVENREHTSHTVVLVAPQRHTLHVHADGGATVLISGLPDGSYKILLDGTSRGQLVVGAQGGP